MQSDQCVCLCVVSARVLGRLAAAGPKKSKRPVSVCVINGFDFTGKSLAPTAHYLISP